MTQPSEQQAQPNKTVGKRVRVKWSILDALLILGMTLATQIVLGLIFVTLWVAQHAAELTELENADELAKQATETLLNGPVILTSSIMMYVVWTWGIWRASYKRGLRSFAKDFWLKQKFPRDIFLGLSIAALLRLAEFGVLAGLGALGVNMDGADNSSTVTGLTGFWYIVNAIVIASFLGPFLEEVLFRGLILQSFLKLFRKARVLPTAVPVDLTQLETAIGVPTYKAERAADTFFNRVNGWIFKHKNILAALFTSVIFGFMHFQGFETFGQIFVVLWTGTIGFILAMVVYKTKRLGTAIYAHIFFNLSGVLLATFM